ncbi:MAG: YceI family protein [Balneolaceae bacterium]|nr:MAG: YceI family protein [Balneolaceae bacterium]
MYSKKIITTITVLLFVFSSAVAQDVTYTLADVSEFKIDGDSNIRTWAGDINEADATLVLTGVDNLTIESLTPEAFKSLHINIAVSGIETDTDRLTTNLRNYLKKDEHPYITFNLKEITQIEKVNGKANITAKGTINAAGVENIVTMNVEASVQNDGKIRFVGTQDLLMTSFNIDPPTALFGTVRAHDEIQIIFDVTFAR